MSYGFFECLEGPFNCLPCTISKQLRKIIDFAQLGVLLRASVLKLCSKAIDDCRSERSLLGCLGFNVRA